MFINNIMFTSKMLRSYKKKDKEETTNRSKLHKHYIYTTTWVCGKLYSVCFLLFLLKAIQKSYIFNQINVSLNMFFSLNFTTCAYNTLGAIQAVYILNTQYKHEENQTK